jgi:hypothetical protein
MSTTSILHIAVFPSLVANAATGQRNLGVRQHNDKISRYQGMHDINRRDEEGACYEGDGGDEESRIDDVNVRGGLSERIK